MKALLLHLPDSSIGAQMALSVKASAIYSTCILKCRRHGPQKKIAQVTGRLLALYQTAIADLADNSQQLIMLKQLLCMQGGCDEFHACHASRCTENTVCIRNRPWLPSQLLRKGVLVMLYKMLT